MVDEELTNAVVRLEVGLRRLPFREGSVIVAGRKIELKHPIDIEGKKDADYLVASFPSDLPTFWLHRHVRSSETYARELALTKTPTAIVSDWARCISKVDPTSQMPFPLRLLRLTLRLLWPAFWASGMLIHLREVGGLSRIGERFGRANLGRPDGRVVWMHAASLGEAKQLREIVRTLTAKPNVTVVVTTFTATSAAWLARACPEAIHQFAPIDSAGCVTRFLEHWRPDILVIAENELWPEMILKSAEAGLLLIQVGARPSKTRRRFARSVGFLLNHFATITCITEKVRMELIDCGVDRSRIVLCQDVRKATPRLGVDEAARQELAIQIDQRRVWVAASTHNSDLDIVLDAHTALKNSAAPLLIIAPRHLRDANKVRIACLRRGLKVAQRSMGEAIAEDVDVYLADSFGELGTFFSLTQIVYLGGGLGGEGGHNPYEPAAFGCAVLSGPRVENFEHAFHSFREDKIASFVEAPEELSRSINALWAAKRVDVEGPEATPVSGDNVYQMSDIVISQFWKTSDPTSSVQGAAT